MGFSPNSKWISFKNIDSPKFMKSFIVNETNSNITLVICGLGFFEAYINGKRVSNDYLVPVWSDYEPRIGRRMLYPLNDTFTHRIYYLEYDVSDLICIGENKIEVILGNGWYNQNIRNVEGDFWYGNPRLRFDIFDSGNAISSTDENVLVSESQVVFNNIYFGEKQDFRIKDNYIYHAEIVFPKEIPLEKQNCPPDRIIRTIVPKEIGHIGSKVIYDVGENTSGWVSFFQNGVIGEKTIVRYSEKLFDDGSLNHNYGGDSDQIQENTYISDGHRNFCRPKFTYHGFRYIEIDGPFDELCVEVVCSDVNIVSSFESDNEILNTLFDNFIRTELTNMHCGVPSDCPHRERLGYTGDGQVTCDGAMQFLDAKEFYKKWIQDILDCQDIKSGHIQHTAPFYGGGGGPGGWGSAIVIVPYFYYKNYGDIDFLSKCYAHMEKWLSYMDSRLEDNLITHEEDGGWCLGDWGGINCEKERDLLPEAFVNTYFYIKSLQYMQELAMVLQKDCSKLHDKEEKLKESMKKHYLEKDGIVLNGMRGAEAFWCDIGMGNDEMLKRIKDKYDSMDEFDTAMFGTDILIRTLFLAGYSETAINLLCSKGENSYASQFEKGASTFWECWDGCTSLNHPMLGAPVKYLLTEFIGIHKEDGAIFISPKPVDSVKYAKGQLHKAELVMKIKNNMITFDVSCKNQYIFKYNDFETVATGDNTYTFKWR